MKTNPRNSPGRYPPPTRTPLRHASWPLQSLSDSSASVEIRDSHRESSARTSARALAVLPPAQCDRSHWGFPMVFGHRMPSESILVGCLRACSLPTAPPVPAGSVSTSSACALPRCFARRVLAPLCSMPRFETLLRVAYILPPSLPPLPSRLWASASAPRLAQNGLGAVPLQRRRLLAESLQLSRNTI